MVPERQDEEVGRGAAARGWRESKVMRTHEERDRTADQEAARRVAMCVSAGDLLGAGWSDSRFVRSSRIDFQELFCLG
jgi:hypothetical protein